MTDIDLDGLEKVARIIDPRAWANHDADLERAAWYDQSCENITQRRLANALSQQAADAIAPSVAKASAILSLLSGLPASSAVPVGEGGWRPYEKFAVKVGDEVWVRATVTDNCTSCCGVRIPTIHREVAGTYVKPKDVRFLSPPLVLLGSSGGEEQGSASIESGMVAASRRPNPAPCQSDGGEP